MLSSNEKILAQLQKNLGNYRDRKESLEHRLIHVQEQLNSMTKLVSETEEAIAALEGRTTETRRMLEEVLQQTTAKTIVPNAPTASNAKEDPSQPPAEPGYRWVDGNLVPMIPDGLIALDDEVAAPVPLPPVDDEFDEIDPMEFNPKY